MRVVTLREISFSLDVRSGTRESEPRARLAVMSSFLAGCSFTNTGQGGDMPLDRVW